METNVLVHYIVRIIETKKPNILKNIIKGLKIQDNIEIVKIRENIYGNVRVIILTIRNNRKSIKDTKNQKENIQYGNDPFNLFKKKKHEIC